jgi:hypothetical protein
LLTVLLKWNKDIWVQVYVQGSSSVPDKSYYLHPKA